MELIVVYKSGGQGRGELESWPGNGTGIRADKFLGGSQVRPTRIHPPAHSPQLDSHTKAFHVVLRAVLNCSPAPGPLPPLTLYQKMEVAYVEHVLKQKISHKLDIDQFRRKEYEKPKVR